jgi:hypothetical protein
VLSRPFKSEARDAVETSDALVLQVLCVPIGPVRLGLGAPVVVAEPALPVERDVSGRLAVGRLQAGVGAVFAFGNPDHPVADAVELEAWRSVDYPAA